MHSLTTPNGQSIRVIDYAGGPMLPSAVINCYSALSLPAYRRAVEFLSANLASFSRRVRQDGAKPDAQHPLDRLLGRRPNGYQNATNFWRAWFLHAAHTGNGYARIERDTGTFAPAALHNLLPEDVTPFRLDRGDGRGLQQFYHHRPTKSVYAGADVLHLQAFGYDGMTGTEPVMLHEGTLRRAATIERYQVEFLRRGTVIRGAVEVPAVMTTEGLAEMKAILRTYRGADGEDDMLILTEGAKLNNQTTTPQESQLVEQASYTTKQIAQMTGVPPEFLFELSEAKYNAAIEQSGQWVVRYCLRPWIELTEDELTTKLLTDAEQDAGLAVHVNPDALLRGSSKEQMDIVTSAVRSGVYTPNEGRAYLGQSASDDLKANTLTIAGDTTPKRPDGESRAAAA